MPREENNIGQGEGSQIHWHQWSPAAFDQAQAQDKPMMLSIGAVWCYWCHVMDETTYQDADVVQFINQHFIPVRVDNDHRPDVNTRYNVGGWPTTAFLTPHGGMIGGATYLPADQLLAMLVEIQQAYQQQKPQLYEQGNGLLRQRREQVATVSAGAPLEQIMVDRISRRVIGTYDPRHGGFGEDLKFPSAPILRFLLHLFRTTGEEFYRVILEKTLDRMAQGQIFDQVEGGFFRYCASPDWTAPQYEKLLEDNINLAQVYLEAGLLLENQEYGDVASRTIDYLMNNLYDETAGGFRGSQGAHSDYFSLPLEARQQTEPPPTDPFCYTSWSAQAVSMLLEASWKLPRPELAATALTILERIDGMARSGRLSHVYGQDGPKATSGGDLLTDWACLLNALSDAYNQTVDGEHFRTRAEEVAAKLMDSFADTKNGGFFDVEQSSDAVGYLKVREKPLPENITAVFGLLKLNQATLREDYKEVAEATLRAYVEANRSYGEFAASYALALDLFLNSPVEITIEGNFQDNFDQSGTRDMLRAAAQIASPHLVLKPVAIGGNGALAQAHVCLNTVCLPPVSDPSNLATTVEEAFSDGQSPFENIFEKFTGF